MKILGLIAEYNPFHNGHLIHLTKSIQLVKPDLTIVLITSTFNSRGEVSLLTNQEKTDILLKNKVDLVIEMPFIYGLQSADMFALNAIKLLNSFKVTNIVCGSEFDNYEYIKKLVSIASSSEYNKLLKENISVGLSYKIASNKALNDLNIKEPSSNDMLNWKYLEAINKINAKINLDFIKRESSNYHDKTFKHDSICSATAIRERKEFKNYVPKEVESLLEMNGILTHSNIDKYITFLRSQSKEFSNIYNVTPELSNLFKKSISLTFDEITNELTTKRFTKARIRRMLLCILFNITKEEAKQCLEENLLIRVIGFTELGRNYLKNNKEDISYFTNLKDNISSVYDLELRIIRTVDLMYNSNLLKNNFHLPVKYKKET